MVTDTSTTPDKKLTGAALAAPDGQAPQSAREEFRDGALTEDASANLAELDSLRQRSAEFDAAREDVDKQLGEARERIAELENARDRDQAEWAQQRDSLLADTSAAVEARDKAEAKLAKAKAKPATSKGEVSATPRKLGAIDDILSQDELKAAIDAADKVEVAFSDGKREVAGLAPVIVAGAWRPHARGLLLDGEVTIDGPSTGTSTHIAGYALLLDGKQVAYSERSDPLTVTSGQKVGLTGDILF